MPKAPIALRGVLLERLMQKDSEFNKDIIDLLVDARRWWADAAKIFPDFEEKYPKCPIDDAVIVFTSLYLRERYIRIELLKKERMRCYNKTSSLQTKLFNQVSND